MAMTGGTAVLVHTGYGNGNTNYPIKLYVYYKTSQDVENNRSTITCGMYVTTVSTSYEIGDWDDFNGSYVGTKDNTFDGSFSKFGGTKWLVENKSFTVDHNADGSKTATIYWKWGVNSPWGRVQNPSGSFNLDLPTIPRASKPTISSASVAMGSQLTIYTNRASTAFTHTLRYTFGTSETIATGVKDSFKWTVPLELAKRIPSSRKDNGTIYCDTYNGSKLIGTESVRFEATVPENDTTKPSLNPVLSPTGNLPDAFAGMYIQGKTGVSAAFNAGSNYSTVSKCTMTVDSKTYTGDPASSSAIGASGNIPVICKVTDAREFSRTVSKSITVHAYSSPKIKNASVYRSNESGVNTSGGTYLRIKFSTVFSTVNGINSCSASFRVKPGSGSWGSWVPVSGESYDANLSGYVTDPEETYSVQIAVVDAIGDRNEYTYNLSSAFHTMHLAKGGKGIAFGKKSTSNMFECGMNAAFLNPIMETTGVRYSYAHIARGTAGEYGYIKFARITIKSTYADLSITFTIRQRKKDVTKCVLRFSSSSSTDPAVDSFYKDGDADVSVIKSDTSVWDIVVNKSDKYDYVHVEDLNVGKYNDGRISIEYTDTMITQEEYGSYAAVTPVMRDYIVESGASGIWTYEKWKSGKAVCWGEYVGSTGAINTVWENTYYADKTIPAINYPFEFTSLPALTTGVHCGGWLYLFTSVAGTNAKTPVYSPARPASSSSITIRVNYIAIGRWK